MTPAAAARYLRIEVNSLVMELNQNARSRANRGVNLLRNAALVVLGQDGSGRVYHRDGRVQVASAPGEPAAPDLGNLRKNWRMATLAFFNGKGLGINIHMRITSDMFYSMFQEKGTRFIAPRPYHDRIKTKARPQIVALFSSI